MSRSVNKLRRLAQGLSRAAAEPTPALPAEGAEGEPTTALKALAPHLSSAQESWAQYAADESVLQPGPLFPDFDASLSLLPDLDRASPPATQEERSLDDPVAAVVRAADEAVQALHFRLIEQSVSHAANIEQASCSLEAAEAKAAHAEAERALLQAERDEAVSSAQTARDENAAFSRALEAAQKDQTLHEKSKAIVDALLASHERLREVEETRRRQEKAALLRQMAAQAEEQEGRLRALAERALKQHAQWLALPPEGRKRALLPASTSAIKPRKSEPLPGAFNQLATPQPQAPPSSEEHAHSLARLEDKLVRRTEQLAQAQIALRRQEREGDQARFAAEVAQQDTAQLRARVTEAEADLSLVREKLAATKTELDETKAHVDAQHQAGAQDLTDKAKLSTRIAELEQEVRDVRAALEQAETARAAAQDEEQRALERARGRYQETKVLREELSASLHQSKTLALTLAQLEEQLRMEGAKVQAIQEEKDVITASGKVDKEALLRAQEQLEESRTACTTLDGAIHAATGEVKSLSHELESARQEHMQLASLLSEKEKETASLTEALVAAEKRAQEESTFATRAAEEQMLLQQTLARTERSLSKATAALEAQEAERAQDDEAVSRPTPEALLAAEAERDAVLSQLGHLAAHVAAVETRWAHALAMAHSMCADLQSLEKIRTELGDELVLAKEDSSALLSAKVEMETRLREAMETLAKLDSERAALLEAQESQDRVRQVLEAVQQEKTLLETRVQEVEAHLATLGQGKAEAESGWGEARKELAVLREKTTAVEAELSDARVARYSAIEELESLKRKAQAFEQQRMETVRALESAQAEVQRSHTSSAEQDSTRAEVQQLYVFPFYASRRD